MQKQSEPPRPLSCREVSPLCRERTRRKANNPNGSNTKHPEIAFGPTIGRWVFRRQFPNKRTPHSRTLVEPRQPETRHKPQPTKGHDLARSASYRGEMTVLNTPRPYNQDEYRQSSDTNIRQFTRK